MLILLLLYAGFRLLPGQFPLRQRQEHGLVKLIPALWAPDVWTEVRFLALAAIAGAVGNYIHLTASFADYLGNRQSMGSRRRWCLGHAVA